MRCPPRVDGHSQVDYTGSVGAGLLDDGMGPREILVGYGGVSRPKSGGDSRRAQGEERPGGSGAQHTENVDSSPCAEAKCARAAQRNEGTDRRPIPTNGQKYLGFCEIWRRGWDSCPVAKRGACRAAPRGHSSRRRASASERSWRAVWDDFRNWLIRAA